MNFLVREKDMLVEKIRILVQCKTIKDNYDILS